MPKLEQSQALGVAPAQRNRAHLRRKLSPMAYVELGQDNGGILLNLSEGGFAVQSALALTSRDFPSLRFQVPAVQGWLTASGRIAWISDSKKEAGIQFTNLPATTRAEIERWVASEETPADARGNTKVGRPPQNAPKQHSGTGGDIFTAPARPASATVPPPHAGATLTSPAARPVNTPPAPAVRATTARPPIAASNLRTTPAPNGGNGARAEQAANRPEPARTAAIEEPAPDHHHFTEYSMFAAQPESVAAWDITPKRGLSWTSLTLLALLLSGLFFLLGATVGRTTVSQWMEYITGLRESPSSRRAAAPAENPPQDDSGTQPQTEQEPAPNSDPAQTSAPGTDTGTAAREPSASTTQPATNAGNRNNTSAAKAHGEDSKIAARKDRNKAPAIGAKSAPDFQRTPQSAPPRSYDDLAAGSTQAEQHAILVNAPAAGSPPFFVNLPSDPVSASSTVAISAQRSILIAPRPTAYGGSQRVVIGKLISHSDPFYPADARNKGIQGSVVLRATVGRTGRVIGVTPLRGPTELIKAATTAVREWRYEPTYVDGDPTETRVDVTVVFRAR